MRLRRYLSEASDSPVGIFVGRMSPPTKAHQKIIADALRKYKEVYVIIIEGAKSSQDPKNFLSFEQRRDILKITNPGAILIKSDYGFIPYIIKSNNIDTSGGVAIIAGPDRIKNYQVQFKKETYTVTYDEPPRMMAATDLRKAMAENDFETYKKMAASGIDNEKWYKKLRALFKAKGNQIVEAVVKVPKPIKREENSGTAWYYKDKEGNHFVRVYRYMNELMGGWIAIVSTEVYDPQTDRYDSDNRLYGERVDKGWGFRNKNEAKRNAEKYVEEAMAIAEKYYRDNIE